MFFHNRQHGFSLIGILISIACVVVLMSIYMTSVSKSVTGGKGTSSNTSAWGMMDQIQLQTIGRALLMDAITSGQYLTPSEVSRSGDVYENTSANFWSAMLLQNMINPDQLVSQTDRSWVEVAQPDYRARHFDPNFSADLSTTFNVSFAHMPLWGDRLTKRWNSKSGKFPLLGNRGPQDGAEGTTSITLDDDGVWRGWVYCSDGSIDWVEGTSVASKWRRNDGVRTDIIFQDEADSEDDAILGYTIEMDDYGPTFIWD
ncbi:MAG: type II secretion system protein [Phycisphaerales bacterium]|nr:type II secretion system protein [Planctomycetota bacterium]MBL6996845.1 type II secretion system protein [Phycisphaerales bacterium]